MMTLPPVIFWILERFPMKWQRIFALRATSAHQAARRHPFFGVAWERRRCFGHDKAFSCCLGQLRTERAGCLGRARLLTVQLVGLSLTPVKPQRQATVMLAARARGDMATCVNSQADNDSGQQAPPLPCGVPLQISAKQGPEDASTPCIWETSFANPHRPMQVCTLRGDCWPVSFAP
jgi:hypothetical protein